MSKEFLFISGQIRALEDKLLSVNRLDRMIGAEDATHAFRVLTEMQYAQYIDETVAPKDFLRIIQKGLEETKQFLTNGTDDARELNAIWWKFDANNIKRALKARYADGVEHLTDFSEEAGYSSLGNGSLEEINHIIFDQPVSPEHECTLCLFSQAIAEAKMLLEPKTEEESEVAEETELAETPEVKTPESEDVFGFERTLKKAETIIDKAYYTALAKVARGNRFLKKYLGLIANAANLRTLTRSILVLGEKPSADQHIPYGDICLKSFEMVEDRETLESVLLYEDGDKTFGFRKMYRANMTDMEVLHMVEKHLDSIYQTFLNLADRDSIGEIEVPFTYFERRFHNARMLKFVMYAKFHGMETERIYDTVHNFDLINVTTH